MPYECLCIVWPSIALSRLDPAHMDDQNTDGTPESLLPEARGSNFQNLILQSIASLVCLVMCCSELADGTFPMVNFVRQSVPT